MDNYFDFTSEDDKEMASSQMEEQFSMSNQEGEGFSILDKYQASHQPAGPSRPSNTRRRRCQGVIITQEQRRERNKEINRAFRQRRKEQENQRKENLHFLNKENTVLVRENQVLKTERDSMAQNLKSAATETIQLQSEIFGLNRDIATRQQFVDIYTNQLIATNVSHLVSELGQHEIENDILSQTETDWENWDSEKEQLLQNMARLEAENKSLKLQLEALSDFINTNEDGQQALTASIIYGVLKEESG